MTKFRLLILCLLVLLAGCSKPVPEVDPEPAEPVFQAEQVSISFYTLPEHESKTLADFKDMKIAIPRSDHYDYNHGQSVKQKLIEEYGYTEDQFVIFDSLSTAFEQIHDDAGFFIISEKHEELIKIAYKGIAYSLKTLSMKMDVDFNPVSHIKKDKDENHSFFNEPFAIYISGIDQNVPPENPGTGDYPRGGNDVNIVMAVNPVDKRVTMVSLPRDTETYGSACGYTGTYKLTDLGRMTSPECIQSTMEARFDVEIDHYVQVSFQSFKQIIDLIGGIRIEMPESFCTDGDWYRGINEKICFNEGDSGRFMGEEVLALARNRYNINGGDFGRIMNHQLIINGILSKLIDNPNIIDITKLILHNKDYAHHTFELDDLYQIYHLVDSLTSDDYEIDNYFVLTGYNPDENKLHQYVPYKKSLAIAKGKLQHTLGTYEPVEGDNYYEEIITVNITKGSIDY